MALNILLSGNDPIHLHCRDLKSSYRVVVWCAATPNLEIRKDTYLDGFRLDDVKRTSDWKVSYLMQMPE